MRRLVPAVAACLLLMTAAPVRAASGLKIGLNASTMYSDGVPSYSKSALVGLNAGAYTQFDFLPFLGLQAELLYSQKGIKLEAPGVEITYRYHYIELPLLLRGMFPIAFLKPHLDAGAYAAVLVGATASATTSGMKRFDYGLAFGGGVDFDFEAVSLTSDIRWTMGLAKVYDVGTGIKNGVVGINVGLGF